MDEVARRTEELGDVEGGLVVGLHAEVPDVHVVSVVVGAGRHVVPLAFRCVQDVRDAHAPQSSSL